MSFSSVFQPDRTLTRSVNYLYLVKKKKKEASLIMKDFLKLPFQCQFTLIRVTMLLNNEENPVKAIFL